MTGGLSGQTCSRCLTVEEQGGVTVGYIKSIGRRKKKDWSLPVLSVFADLEAAIQKADSESCSQRGRVLSEQAGTD